MQVYGRGLRRRLPTMLDGDQRRIRLVYSLMLSLPGTPTPFYAEEDRDGREPRPTGANGGAHTDAMATRRARRVLDHAHRRSAVPTVPGRSILPRRRQRRPATQGPRLSAVLCAPTHSRLSGMPRAGWGAVTILDQQVRSVLAHRCDWSGSTVLLCHNLGSAAKTVRLTLDDQPKGVRWAELFHAAEDVTVGEGGTVEVKLEAYAARWYRLVTDLDTALI